MKKVLLVLLVLGMVGIVNAEITMTMTEAGDGGIVVTGVGSGLINTLGEENPNQTDPGETQWDWDNWETNFLNDAAVSDLVSSSCTGTMYNITTGESTAVTGIMIDSDLNSSLHDDMDLYTANGMPSFTHGDEFSIDFVAIYTSAQVLFTGLNPGSHVKLGDPADDESPFGDMIVTVVPEPMTLSLLGFGGLALIRRRRA